MTDRPDSLLPHPSTRAALDDTTFRHLVEQADDCILVVQHGVIRFINPAGLTLLDATDENQLVGQSPATLFHPECQAFITEAIAQLVASPGRLPQTTQRMVSRKGRIFFVDVTASTVQSDGETLVRVRCRDATHRTETEMALAESERRLRELAESISDVFWSRDVVNDRILYASPNYEAMFGHSVEELYRDPDAYMRWIHPDDQIALRAALARDPYRVNMSYRLVRPEHPTRWVEIRTFPVLGPDGTARRTVGIGRDITSLRAAEERLSESEAGYRLLFQHNPHAMWVYDTESYRFLAVNETAVARYGWTEEEFLAMTLYDIRPPEDLSALAAHLATFRDRTTQPVTWRHRTKAGQHLEVEIVSNAIDFGGRSARLVLVHDVTERRKFESQQLRAQRMESIGTLAGGIAHDLNNVLAPILMAVEILKLNEQAEGDREVLDTIEGSARHGAELVRHILSFTRGLEGVRARVEPNRVMQEVAKLARGTFDRRLTVIGDFPEGIWPILADATQIHQVILNLAVNARDAMPAGGALRLGASNRMVTADEAAMHGLMPGRHVVLTVADTGTGIPAAIRDRIFDPFFTTKELGKGTGLGLATAQAVVHSHRGRIALSSDVGTGSTFEIYFPALEGESARVPAASQSTLPRGNGETVLVVDDEAAIRMITRQTLETFGYQVITAEDGADAVAQFSHRADTITLVVTDMMMPVMDGVATITALRKIAPDVRLIAVSGMGDAGMSTTAATVGVTDFLSKPYSMEDLVRTVDRVIRRPAPVLQ